VRAPFIRSAFDRYATGTFSFTRLREALTAEGYRGFHGRRISLSRVQRILTNPFYYGVFVLSGEMHEGSHPPLVTKALFDRVQGVMRRRSKPSPSRCKTYQYQGLLKCGECGAGITMETQKGHHYLRCTKRLKTTCKQPYLCEESFEAQAVHQLSAISIADEVAAWMLSEIERKRSDLTSDAAERRAVLARQLSQLDRKLDRLTVAHLDAGAFSAADFRERKKSLIEEKQDLTERPALLDESTESRFEPIKSFINEATPRKYAAPVATAAELRAMLETTGSNLLLQDRRLRLSPRGAWKLVAGEHVLAGIENAAPLTGAANSGKTRTFPRQWAVRDSNPLEETPDSSVKPSADGSVYDPSVGTGVGNIPADELAEAVSSLTPEQRTAVSALISKLNR
jgi:site-specific DNA recombinase